MRSPSCVIEGSVAASCNPPDSEMPGFDQMNPSPPAAAAAVSAPVADDPPRVKFLCSFGGSILPRPSDGKLRYVGGETRIVSLPREFTYEELMARMRELFEGAWALKYQQPDEDLDALVSVVNDDDVMNMMEEYEKLGAGGDGVTRLRVFLFSHPDNDVSSPNYDADERETERRYVDALNSLSDGKPPSLDASAVPVENNRVHLATEQFFGPPAVAEIGLHHQSNFHHLTIPHLHSHGHRYNDMDGPRSPAAYYSPGHYTPHDLREFPPSPSDSRYQVGFGDLNDRFSEEYARQFPVAHQQPQYEHHPPFVDSGVWLPPGGTTREKAGFPGNLGHTHNVYQATVPEARYHDPRWMQGQPHMEQSNAGSEFTAQFSNSCVECLRSREAYLLSQEMKLEHGVYPKEQGEHRSFYKDLNSHERGRAVHHRPFNQCPGEPIGHCNENYMIDCNGMNFPYAHGNFYDGHSVSPNCIIDDDPHYICPGTELGSQVYHDQQAVGIGTHMHVPGLEDSGIRHGSNPSAYVADSLYQAQHGSTSVHPLRRNVQGPVRPGPSYEASGLMLQANGAVNMGFVRSTQDGSPRFSCVGIDDQIQSPWTGSNGIPSQKIYPINGSTAPECYYDHAPKSNLSIHVQENQHSFVPESVQCQPGMLCHEVPAESVSLAPSSSGLADDKAVGSPSAYHPTPRGVTDISTVTRLMDENNMHAEACGTNNSEKVKEPDVYKSPSPKIKHDIFIDSNGPKHIEEGNTANLGDAATCGPHEQGDFSVEHLSFLPELIASVKKSALEGAEVVKARAQANGDADPPSDPSKRESSPHGSQNENSPKELDVDSDSEEQTISKIEQTTAEAEALNSGLQTIKNDDLEEIRALGSGTYGAVYHGKWKGSDVAIKRIKASCFAGRPSERERLIADFWKEALILSSLHHPNVVSFYGIVRDGPDGSLATVTEFMVNGSLKQFLQKKDRTIDRRKRLIIAMDAAFGMEYLHGKNIVHFDLKCENLLVNMRDPHRPVCKIGDLGLSKVRQQTLVSGGIRGTLPWMAPELLSGKSNMVTEKIDVYSFGIVMWEVLTGEEPYADMHCASIIGGIVNNSLRPQIPTWCDPEWKSLMESCWSSDPGERPSFSEISRKLRKMSAAINVK